MALLPKLKTKDKAKSVSLFGKATNQNCALLPAPSFLHSASPPFAIALAQKICKNLSYFPRIVERECTGFGSRQFCFLACFPRTQEQEKSLVPFLQGRTYFVVTM